MLIIFCTESNSTLTGKIYNGDIYYGRKYAVYLGEGSEILCTGTFILFHTILIGAHCVSHLEPPSYGGYKIIYITKESSSDASSTIGEFKLYWPRFNINI